MKIVRLRGDEWAPGNCQWYFVLFLDYRAGKEDAARRRHGSAACQEASAAPRASEASATPPRPCHLPTMSSRELFSQPAVVVKLRWTRGGGRSTPVPPAFWRPREAGREGTPVFTGGHAGTTLYWQDSTALYCQKSTTLYWYYLRDVMHCGYCSNLPRRTRGPAAKYCTVLAEEYCPVLVLSTQVVWGGPPHTSRSGRAKLGRSASPYLKNRCIADSTVQFLHTLLHDTQYKD